MSPATLDAQYFDGRSARAQPVQLRLDGDELVLSGAFGERRYPQRQVQWPERVRHGQRQAHLPDGGVLSSTDARAWDDWAHAATGGRGLGEGLALRLISSWPRVMASLLLTIALLAAAWIWGLPAGADALARRLPASLEASLGDEALGQVRALMLKPSALSQAEQQQWRERFAHMVASQAGPDRPPTTYQLHFHAAPKAMGPNAFALPGGHIVVTDALVALLKDQPDSVLGVMAHELGHVRERHGLRRLLHASLGSALAGVMMGDFSGLLAGAPLLLELGYSRDFEREADHHARQLLLDSGRSPRAMVVLFERLQALRQGERRDQAQRAMQERGVQPPAADEPSGSSVLQRLDIAFSTHPADAERIAFFSR